MMGNVDPPEEMHSPGTPMPDTSPPEERDPDSPEMEPEEEENPPKPVDDPDLPEEGDPEDHGEESVPEKDFQAQEEGNERLEEPNDLSDVEKEFEESPDFSGEEGDRNPGPGVA